MWRDREMVTDGQSVVMVVLQEESHPVRVREGGEDVRTVWLTVVLHEESRPVRDLIVASVNLN